VLLQRTPPRRAVAHPRISLVFRSKTGAAPGGRSLTRDETRCVVNAAAGHCEAVLPRVAPLRTARIELFASTKLAVAFVAIDMRHADLQRIAAARGVEARFLWKRFYRSRNDARP
jgi:hypothetical protein